MPKTSKKILIVEDETPLRNALAEKLGREGFQVFQGANGEEGLKTAIAESPDLILLDLVMPKMDGMTMLKQLREHSDYGKGVPVILLTNLGADDQMIRNITKTEPAYYLVKTDWHIEDVVRRVKETLFPPTAAE